MTIVDLKLRDFYIIYYHFARSRHIKIYFIAFEKSLIICKSHKNMYEKIGEIRMKSDYTSFKVKLIKAKNGEGTTILPYIKKQFGYVKFSDAINTIMKNTNFKDYFSLELFPKDINNIVTDDYIPLSFNERNIDEAGIINEIECFIAMLYNFKDDLVLFSKHRYAYEKYLFSGEYSNASECLECIENSLGYSFWLIESNLLLANYTMNVVESGKYYQDLKAKCVNSYIKIFIRLF